MWGWIIQNILLSIIIIFIVHNLGEYLKNTFTVKKTKDVVGFQMQKYKLIMDEIHDTNNESKNDELSEKEKQDMNDDLNDFMLNQINA